MRLIYLNDEKVIEDLNMQRLRIAKWLKKNEDELLYEKDQDAIQHIATLLDELKELMEDREKELASENK
jgi:hypothetical protein